MPFSKITSRKWPSYRGQLVYMHTFKFWPGRALYTIGGVIAQKNETDPEAFYTWHRRIIGVMAMCKTPICLLIALPGEPELTARCYMIGHSRIELP